MTSRSLLVALYLLLTSLPALSCQGRPFGQPGANVGLSSLPLTYSNSTATANIPVTVTLPPVMNGNCNLALIVGTGYPTAFTLINNQNPQNALTFTIGGPFEFNGDTFSMSMYATQGQIYNFQIPVIIPANQTGKPAGSYQHNLRIRLVNVITGGAFAETYVPVTATIATTCVLPPPSLSALDFSSAIGNGAITTAFQRTFSFANAGCSGPARLSLSGNAMALPGSQARIHYSASAMLGSTNVFLDTRTATSSFANAVSAPVSSMIPVTVTALPTATQLPAGTYSATLRVSLEPSQ